MRNFLLAFGAPGELIISLLLSGGPSYLFKICFLVFFPLLPSYALGAVVQDIFSLSPPLRRRSGPFSSLSGDFLPGLNFASHILFR